MLEFAFICELQSKNKDAIFTFQVSFNTTNEMSIIPYAYIKKKKKLISRKFSNIVSSVTKSKLIPTYMFLETCIWTTSCASRLLIMLTHV